MTRWQVAEGTQVNRGGEVYAEGDEFDAPDAAVVEEVARGWVSKVEPKKAAKKAKSS